MKPMEDKSLLKRWFTFDSKREFISWLVGMIGMGLILTALILTLLKLFGITQSPSPTLTDSLLMGGIFIAFGRLFTDNSWLKISIKTLDEKIDRVEARLDKVEARLDKLEVRLDKVEIRLDKVEARLDKLEVRLDKLEARLDKLEVRLDKLEARLDKLETRFNKLETRFNKLEPKFDLVWEDFKSRKKL